MITIFCIVLLFAVFFKLLGLALRVGWGIMKISIYLICFPFVILGSIFSGLFFIAIPLIFIMAILGLAVKA